MTEMTTNGDSDDDGTDNVDGEHTDNGMTDGFTIQVTTTQFCCEQGLTN